MFFRAGIDSAHALRIALLLATIIRRKHENASAAPPQRGQALSTLNMPLPPVIQRTWPQPPSRGTAAAPTPAQRESHRPIHCVLPS